MKWRQGNEEWKIEDENELWNYTRKVLVFYCTIFPRNKVRFVQMGKLLSELTVLWSHFYYFIYLFVCIVILRQPIEMCLFQCKDFDQTVWSSALGVAA